MVPAAVSAFNIKIIIITGEQAQEIYGFIAAFGLEFIFQRHIYLVGLAYGIQINKFGGADCGGVSIGPAYIRADDVTEFIKLHAPDIRVYVKNTVKSGSQINSAVPDFPENAHFSSGYSAVISFAGSGVGIKVKKGQFKRQG